MERKSNKTLLIVLGIIALLILLCCLVLGIVGYGVAKIAPTAFSEINMTLEVTGGSSATATPVPTFAVTPSEPVSQDTLTTLEESVVPSNDPVELACRLKGLCNLPATLTPPAAPPAVGESRQFWVTNVDTNDNFQVTATLAYVTDHVYFWVQDGIRYDDVALKKLADTFENKIYPTDRAFFGSEWSPGIDGDPHIYILYARGAGASLAGYFSSADEILPQVHPYSNGHEMFLFNADTVGLSEEFTYGVLAHEFQHMIHWYQDRNETSWLNEGFSELAAYLNGYDVGGFDWSYLSDADLQLNDWPDDFSKTGPHYGAGFLFTNYFLDRFGEDATKALVAQPQNGLESVDLALQAMDADDTLRGAPLRADDVVVDWMLANFLNDDTIADGRYAYHDYDLPMTTRPNRTISTCPQETVAAAVHQYGADYIKVTCAGTHTLVFQGDVQTGVLPADPYSGDYAFWSNKGDESDMRLTRTFDLSGVSSATFVFKTWYDIETDYDYVYLEASTDGEHWQILTTPSGTDENPSGNSYGWGYNGQTDGWIEEQVDISQFAGQKVWLRFEYVTDAAVNGEGMLIDNIAIPEIGYFSDLESDDGGWQGEGFVRIDNVLPQTFRLALVTFSSDGVQVQDVALNDANYAEIPIEIGGDVKSVVLLVTGTTRYTREMARYQITVR